MVKKSLEKMLSSFSDTIVAKNFFEKKITIENTKTTTMTMTMTTSCDVHFL